MHYQDWTVSTVFHFSFTGSIPGSKEAIGLLPGVSRLDLALEHKLHNTTENLHALSAHAPQFHHTLDLTGCSVVEVREVRHPRRIRHRWRLFEPLRLPYQHRPLHVQTRLAQPPAQPLAPPTQDSKCSAHQTGPILFLSTVSQMVQAHSAWCSALSTGSPPTETLRRFVFRFPRSQDEDSIFRMQRCASLNPVMVFLTDATPAHVFVSVKDPLPSKTTMLPLSITPDTASKGLRTLAPWSVIRLEMSPPPCSSVRTFTVRLSVKLFTSRAHVSLSFH